MNQPRSCWFTGALRHRRALGHWCRSTSSHHQLSITASGSGSFWSARASLCQPSKPTCPVTFGATTNPSSLNPIPGNVQGWRS